VPYDVIKARNEAALALGFNLLHRLKDIALDTDDDYPLTAGAGHPDR
jgi:hypothetical protein